MFKNIENKFLKNFILRVILWTKLPLISYCAPTIVKSTSTYVSVSIPLKRRTKNHLKTMYFGALCIGADFSGGLLVLNIIKKHKSKANLLFKDFNATFLKRAEASVIFECNDYAIVEKNVLKNIASSKRLNFKIEVRAFVEDELIAKFDLTASIK